MKKVIHGNSEMVRNSQYTPWNTDASMIIMLIVEKKTGNTDASMTGKQTSTFLLSVWQQF